MSDTDTEPFWRTMPLGWLAGTTVRVVYRDHTAIRGMLDVKPADGTGERTIGIRLAHGRITVDTPVITVHADGNRTHADDMITSIDLVPGRMAAFDCARIDDPELWRAGDIAVLRNGGEWTIVDLPADSDAIRVAYPLFGIEGTMPRAYIDHALRPVPWTPDREGLWRSRVDDGLYVASVGRDGMTAIKRIRDAKGRWIADGETMRPDEDATRNLAPFTPVDDSTMPDDWITDEETEETV